MFCNLFITLLSLSNKLKLSAKDIDVIQVIDALAELMITAASKTIRQSEDESYNLWLSSLLNHVEVVCEYIQEQFSANEKK